MTTAEALEAITNEGEFEILATRVLRQIFPDCAFLEHLGLNAQAKTIVSPVDGFARVPDSHPHRYVATNFTISSRGELKRKWYGLKSPHIGDLIKNCKEAEIVRKSDPESTFTAFLCTNQRVDMPLMQEGYVIGNRYSVDVVFVAQSQLRDFLDNPKGQPLRKEFFGREATNLSVELLRSSAASSLARYRIEGFSEGDFVPTAAWRQAVAAVDSVVPVLSLVGAPGSGKSVIARSLLKRHVELGGIGFWIPGDFLQESRSLDDAITLTLKQFDAYLGDEAGNAAITMGSQERPLVLVLDDPNRTDRPGMILRKVMGWGRNLVAGGGGAGRSIVLVIPVWESQFSNLITDFEGEKWLRAQTIGPMQRPESIACLRNGLGTNYAALSGVSLDHIADRLKDDPILLSIFARLARTALSSEIEQVLDDVIGRYVDRSLAELASTNNTLKANYKFALEQTTRRMLAKGTLHPEWRQIREWVQPDVSADLEKIAGHGGICHLANQGRREIFEFRHDRILEHQVSEAIVAESRSGQPDWDTIFDPYFVQMTGRAIATSPARENLVDLASQRLPASLVAALAFLRSGDASSDSVSKCAADYLAAIHDQVPSIQNDVLSMLENTRSDLVLTITKDMIPNRRVLLARLRNGDLDAGAVVLSSRYYPSTNFPWLEGLIREGTAHHGDGLVSKMENLLKSSSSSSKAGALTLAGYVAIPALDRAILDAWRAASDQDELVLPALWAALRCSDPVGNLLNAILPAIFSVSDEPGVGGMSTRRAVIQELAFSARHGLSVSVLHFLKSLGTTDERFNNFVFALFERIEHPIAIEFVVRKMAQAAAIPVQPGHMSGVFFWETQWRRTSGFEHAPMPADCLSTLCELWKEGHPHWLRSYAFKLWVRFSGEALWILDLPAELAESDDAVYERAKRGDQRVAERVAEKMEQQPHWLYMVRDLWSDRFLPILRQALSEGDGFAIQALRSVPTDAAEDLIVAYWTSICSKPNAVAAGLYVGTTATVTLASKALLSSADPASELRHAGDYFGFNEQGYSQRITARHLDALQPYLELLDNHDLAHMTEFCASNGYWAWAQENLLDLCRDRATTANNAVLAHTVNRLFPRDDGLIADLDRILTREERQAGFEVQLWAEQFSERSDDPERMQRLLKRWLDGTLSASKFRLAALALRHQGSRQSLAVLNRFSAEPEWFSVEKYYKDTEYAVKRRSLT